MTEAQWLSIVLTCATVYTGYIGAAVAVWLLGPS